MSGLTVQGNLPRKPDQVICGLVLIQNKLAGQKPYTVIVKLFPCFLIRLFPVRQKRAGIRLQASGNVPVRIKIFSGEFPAVGLIGHDGAVPHLSKGIQIVDMRPDIGRIDDPIFPDSGFPCMGQFFIDKVHRIGQGGNMAGGLEVMEGDVIVNSVFPRIVFSGEGRDSGVMVSLTAGTHLSVSVVTPDLDDVGMKSDKPFPVEFQNFAVEVGAEYRVFHIFADDLALPFDDIADNLPSFLRVPF